MNRLLIPAPLRKFYRRFFPRPPAIPQTLCVLPFIHFNIQANGQATPCCVSPEPFLDETGTPLSVRTHSLHDIWNSSAMRNIRQQMLAGEKPTQCSLCYDYEKSGFRSHRMDQNHFFLEQSDGPDGPKASQKELTTQPRKPWYSDLRFDNVCQLKCIICYGGASSQIERDAVHMKWTGEQPIQRIPNRFGSEEWVKEDQLFDELKEIGSGTRYIQLAGGEPFLSTLALRWCNDPAVFAQVRLLISMIDRFVPVFSCPRLDEAGVGCKTQSSH
jgi:MoaA/NifB/PqqE/SkfB family radical SAM enzyme